MHSNLHSQDQFEKFLSNNNPRLNPSPRIESERVTTMQQNYVQGRINLIVGPRHNILCGPSPVAQPEIYAGVQQLSSDESSAAGETSFRSKLAVSELKRISDNSI